MTTVRKFFDNDGKEVAPKDAVYCQELIFDGEELKKSVRYFVDTEESGKAFLVRGKARVYGWNQ